MGQSRPMPKDDHDALTQIWTALLGMNGSGLFSKFGDLEDSVERIEKRMDSVVTIEACANVQDKQKKKRIGRWVTFERVALVIIAILGALEGFNVF